MALDIEIRISNIDGNKLKSELVDSLEKHNIFSNKGKKIRVEKNLFSKKKSLRAISNIDYFLENNLFLFNEGDSVYTGGTFNGTGVKIEKDLLINIAILETLKEDKKTGINFKQIIEDITAKKTYVENYIVYFGNMGYQFKDFILKEIDDGTIELTTKKYHFEVEGKNEVRHNLLDSFDNIRILHSDEINTILDDLDGIESEVSFSILDLFSLGEWAGDNGQSYKLLHSEEGVVLKEGEVNIFSDNGDYVVPRMKDMEMALELLSKEKNKYFRETLFCFAFIFKFFLENEGAELTTIYG